MFHRRGDISRLHYTEGTVLKLVGAGAFICYLYTGQILALDFYAIQNLLEDHEVAARCRISAVDSKRDLLEPAFELWFL